MVSSGMLRRVALVRTDIFLHSVSRLLVAASVVPSSPILVTLMKGALGAFETSVLTRATERNIPGDTILRPNILFLTYRSPSETLQMLKQVYGKGAVKKTQVYE
jgi:hypothetical protein